MCEENEWSDLIGKERSKGQVRSGQMEKSNSSSNNNKLETNILADNNDANNISFTTNNINNNNDVRDEHPPQNANNAELNDAVGPTIARTPFADLSQIDADLVLARTLQEQAYARALQEAEEREMAARLLALAGISESHIEAFEDHSGNAQDAWEEVDPDGLSYEELIALGEVVGTESRGLSADTIASLPSINYKAESSQSGSNDTCVICRLDYEDGETLTLLSCKHSYHPECIHNWLKINKFEVSQIYDSNVHALASVRSVLFAVLRFPHLDTANRQIGSSQTTSYRLLLAKLI
ncbi:hypothetical protein ACFE04_017216 [Oxalis oulophora]